MKKRIAMLLALLTLTGCASSPSKPAPTTEPVPTEPEPTAIRNEPVVKANANPDSIFFTDCYEERSVSPDAIAATWGEATLSAQALRVYYALVRDDFLRSDTAEPAKDVPLWAQISPASAQGLSWEQFFLRRAISLWQSVSALNYAAAQPGICRDSGYLPNEAQHQLYLPEDYPVQRTIYHPEEAYTLPSMHRQYIDNLPQHLQSLAENTGIDMQSLLTVCTDINRAYSYYTELNAYAEYDSLSDNPNRVNIRQMLILPEGGILPDGTVQASEASWQDAEGLAREHLSRWSSAYATKVHPEASFANLAHGQSADTATAVDGGGLHAIAPGQLIAELDTWCFDPSRQPGDTAVIPTAYGISVVYYAGETTEQSKSAAMAGMLESLRHSFDCRVDYSAVSLSGISGSLRLSDVLYPDIGHEQISEIPTFFQQDYPYVDCGGVSMPIGGCGFTSLAMVATYLSDTLITPTEMARRYAREFGSPGGVNGDIFTRITPELGFYCAEISSLWPSVEEAMARGRQAVNLQMSGPFTTGGHYIVLAHLLGDGTVAVRDPSITHYVKLSGFRDEGFEPRIIRMGATQFWIFDNKILTIPACTRCGNGDSYALQNDYVCRKCQIALDRRESFMSNAMTVFD